VGVSLGWIEGETEERGRLTLVLGLEGFDGGDHDFFLFTVLLDEGAEEADFVFEVGGIGGGVVEGGVEDEGKVGVGLVMGVWAAEHQWGGGTGAGDSSAR
jgi:hypothetical protein